MWLLYRPSADPVVPSLVPHSAAATASINLTPAVSSHTVSLQPPAASRGNHAVHKSGHNAGQPPAVPAKQPPAAEAGTTTTATQPPVAKAGEPFMAPASLSQLRCKFQDLFSTNWCKQPLSDHFQHTIEQQAAQSPSSFAAWTLATFRRQKRSSGAC
jgi:hypothetical protein